MQKSEFITLKIYAILGNEIATPVNEQKSPGIYSVEFNSKILKSGIYFDKLSVGEFTEAKKMVLLR
ncbi:MAG: T9SS type A sorting domain-containing protein [Ignavibacteriae bacterium]|nr:T9SS C-terminal target domain-containing protein [Ignavibacteriota bacterium]NOH00003.1 T9SS type A sorting domain-containing protein [Ignavibacteriota bacterium]